MMVMASLLITNLPQTAACIHFKREFAKIGAPLRHLIDSVETRSFLLRLKILRRE